MSLRNDPAAPPGARPRVGAGGATRAAPEPMAQRLAGGSSDARPARARVPQGFPPAVSVRPLPPGRGEVTRAALGRKRVRGLSLGRLACPGKKTPARNPSVLISPKRRDSLHRREEGPDTRRTRGVYRRSPSSHPGTRCVRPRGHTLNVRCQAGNAKHGRDHEKLPQPVTPPRQRRRERGVDERPAAALRPSVPYRPTRRGLAK